MFEEIIDAVNQVIEDAKKELAEHGIEVPEQEDNMMVFESSKMDFKKGSSLQLYSSAEKAKESAK